MENEHPESRKCFLKEGQKAFIWDAREGYVSTSDCEKLNDKLFPQGKITVYENPDLTGQSEEVDLTKLIILAL